MPSTSRNQAIAMKMAAQGKSNLGIPQTVGKEFAAADKAKAARGASPFKLKRKAKRHG